MVKVKIVGALGYGGVGIVELLLQHPEAKIAACADGQLSAHLVRDVVSRHKWLRERRLIESVISPDCGYFVFERVTHALPPGYSVMDARYFGLRGYAGYMKINLLSPSITLLCTEAHADGLRK